MVSHHYCLPSFFVRIADRRPVPNAILVVAALRLQATAEQGGEEGRQEVNAGISDLMVYCSRVGAEGHTYHGKSVIGPLQVGAVKRRMRKMFTRNRTLLL